MRVISHKKFSHKSVRHLPMTRARAKCAFFPQFFSGTLTNDACASFPAKNCSHKSARHLPITCARAKNAFFPEIFSGTLTNDTRAFDARRYAYFTIGLRFCNTVARECLQELGLTDDRINSIEEKLLQDGIVQEGGQVDGRVLEEVVQKRFGRKASKRSRDDEEVETMLRRATIEEVAGPSGDKRRGDGGGQGGSGTGAGHVVDENQLTEGGDGGQEQGKERKRRRVSRTRGK